MNDIKIVTFKNASLSGFSFYYNQIIPAGESQLLKTPVVTANKRGVNDIGFACENGIELYATLSEKPKDVDTIWQRINEYDEINKTIAYLRIVNTSSEDARINVRVILN